MVTLWLGSGRVSSRSFRKLLRRPTRIPAAGDEPQPQMSGNPLNGTPHTTVWRLARTVMIPTRPLRAVLAGTIFVLVAAGGFSADRIPGPHGGEGITPNNWTLTPAGVQIPVGDRPHGAALSPDGRYLAVSNDGQGTQ